MTNTLSASIQSITTTRKQVDLLFDAILSVLGDMSSRLADLTVPLPSDNDLLRADLANEGAPVTFKDVNLRMQEAAPRKKPGRKPKLLRITPGGKAKGLTLIDYAAKVLTHTKAKQMPLDTLLSEMEHAGFTTTSKNPRGLLTVGLRQELKRHGKKSRIQQGTKRGTYRLRK